MRAAFSNLRIGVRLSAGFGAVVLGLLCIVMAGVLQLDRLNARLMADVFDRQARIRMVQEVVAEFSAMARAVDAALVVDEGEVARQVARVDLGKRNVSETLGRMDEAYAGEREEARRALQGVHDRNAAYLVTLTRFTRLLAAQKADDARRLLGAELRPKLDAALAALQALSRVQAALMEETKQDAVQAYRDARNLALLFAAAAMALAIAVAVWLARRICAPLLEAVRVADHVAAGDLSRDIRAGRGDETGQLLAALARMNASLTGIVSNVRAGSEAIAAASTQLVEGNNDLMQRSEEQAASLEESAATLEQLTAAVRQNAENARQASALADGASSVAGRGREVMRRVVSTMSSIHASAKRVEDIVGVINGIAFQTNILALNAAVEAARAGEQGRGFSVVAAEVRALAQRSAAAAKEIRDLIGGSAAEVDEGSKLVAEAGQTMEEIVASIGTVTQLVGQISGATREQSEGIEQVNQALVQMDGITQRNVALVQQSASAVEALNGQSRGLVDAVRVFRLGGAAPAAPAAG